MAEVQKGLEGVVVADTITSLVNGVEGKLIYGGYKIEDLAENALFEEVVYLLWNGRLPNTTELEELRSAIAREAVLDENLITTLEGFPKDANPMAVLESAVAALAFYDGESEDLSVEAARRKAVRLTGQITTICAAWDRIRKEQAPVAPRADLTLAQNFVYMLSGEEPDKTASDAINVYLVLLAEHGMNASTFTSRVVTGTGADIHSAVVAAIAALKGPSHGGANSAAMKMFLEIEDPANVEQWFQDNIKSGKRRIMGIGHRVYKALDPRADILRKHAQALAESSGNTRWFEIADKLADTALSDEYFIERKLYPNVDYFSAIVLYTLKLDVDMFTPLFAMSRVAGWSAHIIEQIQNNRLIRPKANYVGPQDLEWKPASER
ncbi:MAG: citrate/2-methylcitrate synthase [Anaerolineae bacterium]|nr:citrate/2-methylcitrate synthase [Anaerolineae bacterium]